MCCVLGQNTFLSQCHSPPRCINGYWGIVREALRNAGGGGGVNLVMDCHPFQGEVAIFLVASCYMETSLSSGWVGQQAPVQTLSLNNDLLQAVHSKLIQMREQFH